MTTPLQAEEGAQRRLPLPVEAMILPDAGMARVAAMGRTRWALLFVTVCSIFLGVAQAMRVDAREVTLRELDKQGKLATMSDRQIEDGQRAAERVYMVKTLAVGAAGQPVGVLFTGIGLFGLAWLLRGRIGKAGAVFAVAAWSRLPSAIGTLVEAAATLSSGSISPESKRIVPSSFADLAAAFGAHLAGPAARILGAFDVFDLWAAVMLAFGFAAAAQLPTRRAVTGTLVAWVCYRLLRFVATGG